MTMPISNQQRAGHLTIPARSSEIVPFRGSYISVFTTTSSSDVWVSPDNGIANPLKAGTGYSTVRLSKDKTTHVPAVFTSVTFKNMTDADMTIEYVLSLGPVSDTRSVVQGYVQVDLSAPVIETPAAITVAIDAFTILPANALIKERIVQNTGEYPVWWGDDSTDPAAGRGNVIYPGGAATINCWGIIYFKAQEGESRISINHINKVF